MRYDFLKFGYHISKTKCPCPNHQPNFCIPRGRNGSNPGMYSSPLNERAGVSGRRRPVGGRAHHGHRGAEEAILGEEERRVKWRRNGGIASKAGRHLPFLYARSYMAKLHFFKAALLRSNKKYQDVSNLSLIFVNNANLSVSKSKRAVSLRLGEGAFLPFALPPSYLKATWRNDTSTFVSTGFTLGSPTYLPNDKMLS